MITLLSRMAVAKYWAPTCVIRLLTRRRSVSVCRQQWWGQMWETGKEKLTTLPGYLAMQQRDIVHQHLQFHRFRYAMWWVSTNRDKDRCEQQVKRKWWLPPCCLVT
jgi:hypothetical protein